jgi:hypothetical protein
MGVMGMSVSADTEQRFHPLYHAAAYYASLGWHVIPLKPRTKIAAIPWRFYQDNKPQDSELYEWFHEWRINGKQYTEQPNIAVILRDETVQLDFDGLGRDGGLAEWLDQFPALQHLPRVRTGSGKVHIFFAVRTPIQHHDIPLSGGGVIEVRTGRNIAVLPPSIHPNGEPYAWEVTIPASGLPLTDPATVGVKARPKLTVVGREYHEGDPLSEGEIDAVVEAVAPSWTPNHRHALSLAVPGWLASIGAPEEDARTVVSRLGSGDGDRDGEFQRSVRDTYVKAAAGSPTKGWSELRGVLDRSHLRLLEQVAKAHEPTFTLGPPKDTDGNELPWSIGFGSFMRRSFPEPWWIIDNLLPGNQVCIIRGPGGVMKSWFAMHGGVCVASGQDFLGHYVPEARRVLYVQEEMAEIYLHERASAISRMLGIDPDSIEDTFRFISGQSFKIDSEHAERGWPRLLKEIEEFQPSLVIFDPLVEMHDGEENTVEDMRPVMLKLRSIRFNHPLSVWVLHHNNRLDQMRGSTSIRDAADLVIEFKPTDSLRKSQVHFEKARNLRDPQDFLFEIRLVEEHDIDIVRIDTGSKAKPPPFTEMSIIACIREIGPATPRAIAEYHGLKTHPDVPQKFRNTINAMAGVGKIKVVDRLGTGGRVYTLP